MDDKFMALAALVREARKHDRLTLHALNIAQAQWKDANRVLTERLKVLNDYAVQLVNEHSLEEK